VDTLDRHVDRGRERADARLRTEQSDRPTRAEQPVHSRFVARLDPRTRIRTRRRRRARPEREQHRNERPHQQQNRRKQHRPPTKPMPPHRSSSSLRHSRRTYADPTHTFAAVSLHPPTMTTRKPVFIGTVQVPFSRRPRQSVETFSAVASYARKRV